MGLTAIDSSLLIPAVAHWHAEHRRVDLMLQQVTDLVMIGHVLFETYSWLTKSRPRTPPAVAAGLLQALPGPPLVLSPAGHVRVVDLVGSCGLMGSAVYDALIAATALEADVRLLSRDQRAAGTYKAMGVRFQLV